MIKFPLIVARIIESEQIYKYLNVLRVKLSDTVIHDTSDTYIV